MTPLTGVSLMVFFVLACQCMSTLAVVHRESGSWKWPALLFGYQTLLAYAGALLVYQGGRLDRVLKRESCGVDRDEKSR